MTQVRKLRDAFAKWFFKLIFGPHFGARITRTASEQAFVDLGELQVRYEHKCQALARSREAHFQTRKEVARLKEIIDNPAGVHK